MAERARKGPEPRPLADRLWAKADRSGGPDSCWPWTGAVRTEERCGWLYIGTSPTGRVSNGRAHRIAWEVTHGPIAPGVVIRRCPLNHLCVNPAHLTAATRKGDTDD